MRDLLKFGLVGIALFICSSAFAVEQYKLIVLPDNIVTEDAALDSYIYNQTSEFFSNEVINLLNKTDYITTPTVSDERKLLKSKPAYMIPARELTNRYKTSYNIDFPKLKKVASANNYRYALLLTSTLDAENYVMRRTLWDFLNIPGASVIDPAYKISTYAVLVDTTNNAILWSKTFYKTISVVEGRILTRGPSPQTEQLQKIRDYSRMLCPEIAENVQVSLLTDAEYAKESYKIYYDMADFDNIFTKKYRRWYKEGKKDFDGLKSNTGKKVQKSKKRRAENRAKREQAKTEKQIQKQLEVKAEPYKETRVKTNETKIKTNNPTEIIQPLDFEDQSLFDPVNIKRHWKNRLYGDYDQTRPQLRDYDRL